MAQVVYLMLMDQEPKDVRLPVMVGQSDLEAIDAWRYAHHIPTRAEAIRRLIERGLAVPTEPQFDVNFTKDGREGVITSLGGLESVTLSREALDQLFGFLQREQDKYPLPLKRRSALQRE
jgi:hypothetical protein